MYVYLRDVLMQMASRKRGKNAGGKPQPPKKARKKTVVSKKPKAKK